MPLKNPECDKLKADLTQLEKDLAYYEKQYAASISLSDRDRWQQAIDIANDEIAGIIAEMRDLNCQAVHPPPPPSRAVATPWAVLLCKFNDNDTEPFPRSHYERLFTSAGAGSQNMVDFFRIVSQGAVDLSGSSVFGWLTINKKRSEYTGSGPNWPGRQQLVDWAKQAATDAGIVLTPYFGVVVSMNVPTDLFGGGGRQAVCDNESLQPSVLGQEMGHGYGLDHARADGSDDDYQDPWDIMSTWDGAYTLPNAEYDSIGPGMNAWNMRGRGWLDESRVWKGDPGGYDITLTLRPLLRPDLPGYLAADTGNGYLVEFRIQEGLDAAIPEPVILVHRFQDNHSYIMRGTGGQEGLRNGDAFRSGLPSPFFPYTNVEVVSIDPTGRTAAVRLQYHAAMKFWPPHGVGGTVLGGLEVDGGGILISGGRVVPVPPRSPVMQILEQLAAFQEVGTSAEPWTRDALRRGALERIRQQLWRLDADLNPFRVPAPRAQSRQTDQGKGPRPG